MRFGLNTFLVSSGFSDADLHLLETFKAYGADVVELAIVEPASVSVAKLNAALAKSGFVQPIICGAFPPGRDLRGDAAERESSSQYIAELIDLAVAVGSKMVCGPFYSVTGKSEAYAPAERRAQLELIASELLPLCQKAESAGIVLALEPLNRFETDCINTFDQAIELIDLVGSDVLKIHMDTFHMNIEEEDSVAAILRAGDYIGHVHASASHRGLLGEDQVDWSGVLQALSKIDYKGDVVIESFSPDNTVIARAASIWRPLYASPEQLAVNGLNFLKKNWNCIHYETLPLT